MNTEIEAVNKLLLAGEPGNISVDTYSGYTGYKPQAIIDAMNEVFWGKWGFEEIGSELVGADKGQLAICQVSVRLAGIDFQPVGWGQSRVTKGDLGDAKKGAQTDAIKKALSYFSIGSRAYLGLLQAKPGQSNGSTQQQQRQTASTGDEPSDQQLTSIGKLCQALNKPVAQPKTYVEAKALILQLSTEYNARKKTA